MKKTTKHYSHNRFHKDWVSFGKGSPKQKIEDLTSQLQKFTELNKQKAKAFSMFKEIALAENVSSADINYFRKYVYSLTKREDIDHFIFQIQLYIMVSKFGDDFDEEAYLKEMLFIENPEEIKYYYDYLYENRHTCSVKAHFDYMKKNNKKRYTEYLCYIIDTYSKN